MALTKLSSDQNLFEDEFDEVELSQIFELTSNKSNQNLNESGVDKTDDASESDGEEVYIEPMDEENDDEESRNSQICTFEKGDVNLGEDAEDGRKSTGSHDYSRRSSVDSKKSGVFPGLESYRDDELEYTSFDENEDDIAMVMSQEIVATQLFNPQDIETIEVQDVTNYGDVELKVDVAKCLAKEDTSVLEVEKDNR